jgi:hypothetical protein
MKPSHLPATTHTVEMHQIDELNERLAELPRTALPSAERLGLADTQVIPHSSGTRLPAAATLVNLTWQGSPEYPDIRGHFSSDGSSAPAHVAELHTPALLELCRHLKVRQSWGMGTVPPHVS